MVSRRTLLYAAVIFILAFISRSIIFLRVGFPTGDAGQFASFVREFQLNGGLVPATNVLYYPGSTYIYPPLIFLGISAFNLMLGHFLTLPVSASLYELFYLAIIISSIQALFLAFYFRKFQNRVEFLLAAGMLVLFDASLYEMSWGGYPDIIATFFLIVMLYFIDKRSENKRWLLYASVLFIVIAYTHDLTYFYALLVVACIIIFDLLRRNFRSALMVFMLLIVGGVAGSIWWIPRIHFVLGAATITMATGTGLFTEVGNTAVLFQAVPFMIPILFLALVELFASLKRGNFEPIDSFSIALIASASGLFFIFYDPTLTGRMMLFSYTMLMIIVLKNIGVIRKSGIYRNSRILRRNRLVTFTILFLMIMAPVQILFASNTVSYYSSGDFQYSSSLIQYGETHFSNSTILAPNIGTFIAAQDSAKVIIYTGFVVGTLQVQERNAGLSIILASTSQSSLYNISKYNIGYVIVQSSILNTTIYGQHVIFPTPYYRLVGIFDSYYVYKVVGT
ncbi:MAG: hypothetical protein M1327_02030 [Candidatus Thermoplasmatota archaeon]|nr:hypothetical protein [Candidatus Thermoplasmatota archaeon]